MGARHRGTTSVCCVLRPCQDIGAVAVCVCSCQFSAVKCWCSRVCGPPPPPCKAFCAWALAGSHKSRVPLVPMSDLRVASVGEVVALGWAGAGVRFFQKHIRVGPLLGSWAVWGLSREVRTAKPKGFPHLACLLAAILVRSIHGTLVKASCRAACP